jgi:hypothetical protein
LKEKVEAPVKKIKITGTGICCADHVTHLYPKKVGTNFPDKQ